MRNYRIAIVGATGLVGLEFIKILGQRNFPIADVHLYASDHSAGKRLFVAHRQIEVKETAGNSFKDVDIAFFSSSPDISRYFAPVAVQSGAVAIDTSPIFRMLPAVPLVVPEVNIEDARVHKGIIAGPGCITTQMVVALYPLHKVNPIKRIIVSTYQSTSGLGASAMDELTIQSKQVLEGESPVPHVFPHQIGFNLLPETDVFLDNGYTKEEWNLVEETKKVVHTNSFTVSATCVRVPIFSGHSASIYIEFTKPMTVEEARNILVEAPGVKVLDDTTVSLYPQPWSAIGTDEVYVGRIRQDVTLPNGLMLWVVTDNTRKGAALNAIQIAEEMIKREWLKPRGQ